MSNCTRVTLKLLTCDGKKGGLNDAGADAVRSCYTRQSESDWDWLKYDDQQDNDGCEGDEQHQSDNNEDKDDRSQDQTQDA